MLNGLPILPTAVDQRSRSLIIIIHVSSIPSNRLVVCRGHHRSHRFYCMLGTIPHRSKCTAQEIAPAQRFTSSFRAGTCNESIKSPYTAHRAHYFYNLVREKERERGDLKYFSCVKMHPFISDIHTIQKHRPHATNSTTRCTL